MVAAAHLVMETGKKAINLVETMESRGEKFTATTFRFMEPVYVPEDFLAIVDAVAGEKVPTMGKMRDATQNTLVRRWWSWILQHPQMESSVIHRTRSVFLMLPSPI